ncbi:MAG: hypothetical protein ABWZ25_13965 [Chitinophagaceae bacterium]
MITQFEAGPFLRHEIPILADKTYPSKVSLDIYASINYFSDYTKQVVQQHDHYTAFYCFILADKLLREGDRLVQLLIENVFVYAISTFLPVDRTERAQLESMIPATLYSVYARQMAEPGC